MSSQWSQGLVPPPDGVKANFIDPPNELHTNIAVHTSFLTLSTLAIVMRVYTRIHISGVRLGVDDYLAIFSYLMVVAWSGVLFESMKWGVGRHFWDVPPPWLLSTLKYQTFASWIYIVAATSIKLSFLFLYYRLFNMQTKAKWFINVGIVLCLFTNLGMFFGVVFFCIPVEKAWNNSLPGHCSNPAVLAYLTGAWNIVVDIYVLAVPIPLIRGLHMGNSKKMRLGAVFSIGVFACIASCMRLGMTSVLQSSLDITYNMSLVSLWATIEINVGLICSCLMVMPAFLRHHLPESAKSYLRFMTSTKTGESSKNIPRSHGYQKQDAESLYQHSGEDSRNLVSSNRGNHILKTETFTMESVTPICASNDVEMGVTISTKNYQRTPNTYRPHQVLYEVPYSPKTAYLQAQNPSHAS